MRPEMLQSRSSDDVFADFYRAEYPAAVRLAFVLTHSGEQAEDIAQEAFARLHRRFDGLRNPASYLRVSVVNLTRETYRHRTTEDRHLRRFPASAAPAELGDSELLDVLRRLPDRQRIVLVLRYWADWSEADIATAVGCRRGTVKSIASRGLDHLRKELDG